MCMQERLIHPNEKNYFIIALVISLLIYFWLVSTIIGIFYILLLAFISFCLHGIWLGRIRSNGVKLTTQQFPSVYSKVELLCQRMNINTVPDIFIIQSDGMLNAFATRLLGRNFVVLYSDIFELIDSESEEELEFIIAHELAHIQRRHVANHLLLLPAMWLPFLGKAYSRACEYTCDRLAAYYTGNLEASINGLTLLAIGKALYKKVNRGEYILQSRNEKGFFIWFSHILSTHPPLPLRILELERLAQYLASYKDGSKVDTITVEAQQ